ncbi:hypothetical protein IAT38_007416 [Cryptococcus sp. DSM 104549]
MAKPLPPIIIISSVGILLVALAFPRLYILQTIFLTPIYLSSFLFISTSLIIYTSLTTDRSSGPPSPAARQRHALRPLRFTTPAAWSAVLTRSSYELAPPPFSPIHPSISAQLGTRLDGLLQLIIRHFVLPWYARISPSPAFPHAVEGLVRQAVGEMTRRSEGVDWPGVMVSKVLPLVKDHLQHYRSVEHLSSTSPTHPALPLPLPDTSHPALSDQSHASSGTSPSIEAHLRATLKRVLGLIIPEKDQSEVVNTIVREVLLGAVVTPMFDMMCESDFWNRQIDERGGRYLHEQKQVDKFLSALSALPASSSSAAASPLATSKSPRNPTSISADSSSSQFDVFLRSIRKLKTLGEARRLRADVERELRSAKLVHADESRKGGEGGKEDEKRLRRAKKYVERLERARVDIDARISALSGGQSKPTNAGDKSPSGSLILDAASNESINLYSILSDPSSLAYWLEHMERRGRSRLVQYWLTVEGFKDPLEAAGIDSALASPTSPALPDLATSGSATIREDVTFLYEMYFAANQTGVDIPERYRQIIERAANTQDAELKPVEVQRIKHAVYASQKAVYEQMAEDDWPPFRKSELYVKAVSDLRRSTLPPVLSVPLRSPPIASPTVPVDGLERSRSISPSPRNTPLPRLSRPRMPTTPGQASKSLLDLLSPTARSRSSLKTGIPPASSAAPAVSLSPPVFQRSFTDPKVGQAKDLRKVSAGDVDKLFPTTSPQLSPALSGPSTPPANPRRSSQLDFLIGGAEETQESERGKLFGDESEEPEGLPEEEDYVEVRRMEAIQAALSEIIASDDHATGRQGRQGSLELESLGTNGNGVANGQPKSPSSSVILFGPSVPEGKEKKLTSRSAEDLRSISPKPRTPSTPASRLVSHPSTSSALTSATSSTRPSKLLFDDQFPEDDLVSLDEAASEADPHDAIQLAAPGDMQLSGEIARLQEKILELSQQDMLLDTLIRQAELTGNAKELRILRRSQSSVRREQRTAVFQKAQFEQQEEENRLVPGKTRVAVPSSVMTAEDGDAGSVALGGGKQVVRYTIQISQVEGDQVLLGWAVARRYNEFWELDKALREWAAAKGDMVLLDELRKVEMPGKRLVTTMSASFVESRRSGLERYLQALLTSPAICDSHLLRSFLSLSPVPLKPGGTTSTLDPNGPLSSLAPHNIVKSLYKTMATSLDENLLGPNMLDLMYTTLSRQINDFGGLVGLGSAEDGYLPHALKGGYGYPGWLSGPAAGTSGVNGEGAAGAGTPSPIAPMGGESGMTSFTAPICDLFIELFDLKENNWLRRQAIVVILQQFLGGTIERKVRDTFKNGTSPDSFERILGTLQDILFPGGERRPPGILRTEEEKGETRARASRKLGMLIPDVAANMIGRGNARRAARRVFGALQDKRLNQHLMLSILDEVLNAMFPAEARS